MQRLPSVTYTSVISTGSKKGQASSCFIISFNSFWHETSFAVSLGFFLPVGFLPESDRNKGDEDLDESTELRSRSSRAAILILPLRLVRGAGDGERDDGERDDEDTRRRFVVFLTAFPPVLLVRGGGDGEEEICRFRDRLGAFFVFGREVLRVVFFLTTLMLRCRLFWAATNIP